MVEHLYATDAYFLLIIKNTDLIQVYIMIKVLKSKHLIKNILLAFKNRNDKDAEHLVITNY